MTARRPERRDAVTREDSPTRRPSGSQRGSGRLPSHDTASSSPGGPARHARPVPLPCSGRGLAQLLRRPSDSAFAPSRARAEGPGSFLPQTANAWGRCFAQVLDVVGGPGRARGQRGDGEREQWRDVKKIPEFQVCVSLLGLKRNDLTPNS